MQKILLSITLLLSTVLLHAQNAPVEGYIYESNNRGYLNQVKVTVLEYATGFIKGEAFTDEKGFFTIDLPTGVEYQFNATKQAFEPANARATVTANEKTFVKIQMDRKPGYIFDMTYAKAREAGEITDGLTGVRVEIFNNTTNQEMLSIDSTRSQNIQFTMEQGNHYTFLIRKWGFFAKRIEAFVNIKGCILCIDGVDNVNPGVSDNLTRGFKMGTLLANIELQPLEVGKAIQVKNIYYDLGSASLRPESRKELEKLGKALKDNPYINIEIASHTDARGDAISNMNLSQRRAESVVDFLVLQSKIDGRRMTAAGYGETKLLNHCNDANIGVCTDADHQQNRRTELKVTSVSKDDFFAKTLSTIIREERMDVEIQKMSDSKSETTQQVKESEDMPEELRRYIEEQKRIEAGGSAPASTPNTPKFEKLKESSGNGISAEGLKNNAAKNNVTENPVTTSNNKEGKILTDKKIKPTTMRKTQPFVAGYTGYMIEILTNDKELAATNEIFTRFTTLTLENLEKGIAYLVGDFKSKADAEIYFSENVKKRYPKAKIIQYSTGKRQ